jgi:hypothetical protein
MIKSFPISQANEKISNNELTEFSIIRVSRHLCNNMQGKKVIVILELDVLQPGSEVRFPPILSFPASPLRHNNYWQKIIQSTRESSTLKILM